MTTTLMARWWARLTKGYREVVGEPQVSRVAPLPRPANRSQFEGLWIAVLGDEVVSAAETSHQLALKLHDMDHRKRRQVVVEFVRPTADSYIVGAG